MRLALVLLAAVATAALAPPGAAGDPDAATTLSCTPPRTGPTVVLPCSVSGNVANGFLVKVYAAYGNVGNVLVEAKGPGGSAGGIYFSCPVGAVVAVCAPPLGVLQSPVPGTWAFTARPAIVDSFLGDPAYVRMDVDVW